MCTIQPLWQIGCHISKTIIIIIIKIPSAYRPISNGNHMYVTDRQIDEQTMEVNA